jgi:hypothetical protein
MVGVGGGEVVLRITGVQKTKKEKAKINIGGRILVQNQG